MSPLASALVIREPRTAGQVEAARAFWAKFQAKQARDLVVLADHRAKARS